ncbi:MAG: capsule biosynthesis protein [Alphaproteobacteria bacterium]|nr:MAG: capsule biosynthesis protein [Alphaproteobacteria bacterium]
MTTKARINKFRIRRSAAPRPEGAAAEAAAPSAAETDDGFGSAPFPGAAAAERVNTQPPVAGPAASGDSDDGSAAAEIDAIRREGLTGRQLRMARRLAQRHGLAPTSDYDAVRLLRKRGIDPFDRAHMLELVGGEPPAESGADNLPATSPGGQAGLPSTDLADPDAEAREIMRIQRDLARRRRKRSLMLFARLLAFVFLPTFVAGFYYYRVATPMYATHSEFIIQQADAQAMGAAAGLFSGTSLATSQDSIAVQGYLQSRDAMLRLDRDLGFKRHFSDPRIDPLQRLPANATNEQAYKLYRRVVKVSYDPTEGVVKLEVIAADPETSVAFAKALISYAEEQVDSLTQRLREDQMRGARESFEDAERKMMAAQRRVVELQEQLGVVSADAEVSALMSQISAREVELQNEKLKLAQYLDNPRPNQTRVAVTQRNIERLERVIAELRAQLTQNSASGGSLARISGELVTAQADLQTRQSLMAQALQLLESARIEANRQVRYLSLGVQPVAPDEATYPRAFENTVLAFLIFGGIYLMVSITASILREQVSA